MQSAQARFDNVSDEDEGGFGDGRKRVTFGTETKVETRGNTLVAQTRRATLQDVRVSREMSREILDEQNRLQQRATT